jgi:phosphatidylserine/phosphatidylglycerophosphate/cardiolipin synthase-like enzyme
MAKRNFLKPLLHSGLPWLLLATLIWNEQQGNLFFQSPKKLISAKEDIALSVCFTPGGNCTADVVEAIGKANESILIQAYSFTSAPIAKALVEAQKRGVRVEAILDKSNETEKYSAVDFLIRAGIPTWTDGEHAIAHNKVMILDEKTVITGSFNFTKAAQEKNAENLLILHNPNLAHFYSENWKEHAQHSEKYVASKMSPSP